MGLKRKLLNLSRTQKQGVVFVSDVLLSLFSTWLAFTFRLDRWHVPIGNEWIPYVLCGLLFIPFFIKYGLYRAIFRYSGASNLISVSKALGFYGLALFMILLVGNFANVPRSVGVSQPILFFGFVLGLRLAASLYLNRIGLASVSFHNVLIYGAGEAGAQASASLAMTPSHRVVAFLDDEVAKQGQRIHDFTIFPPEMAAEIVKRFNVTDILIAVPSADIQRRREIVNSLLELHVRVRTIPGIVDLARGTETLLDGADLQVIDLLDREPIKHSIDVSLVQSRVIMITGAGGSIGSELCRQIINLRPHHMVLIDHGEFALYTIQEQLNILSAKYDLGVTIHSCLASVKDAGRMESLFAKYKPSVVYHAAAYKHVPLVEANAFEAAANNVIGTMLVALCAQRHGVERFTLISTDKAVRPTNYMGASKRLAEQIIQALAAFPQQKTIFSMVRFGNVLGSSGSVVPLFRRQIAHGGPVTVTHPDVVRYFMTIPEAVGLVLQASKMANGGEVFVLDMGEPVRIIDLAKKMIRLAGFTERTAANPSGEVEIVTVGLRPGEKLYEELLIGDNPQTTASPHIMMALETFANWEELTAQIDLLKQAVDEENIELLNKVLPRWTATSWTPAITL